ncbi:MAG: aminomethyltransferase family protein [Gemmatimonadota bacterium]|nr:aminomethyltransferase family protein [Gemmatimonadota bacterium]
MTSDTTRRALRETPFHERTAPLCEASDWRRWGGCIAASAYELTHEHEYAAIRGTAGLIDVSPLFKYRVTGRDSTRLLDRMITRDVARCGVGQVLYTPWCDGRGKVRDDGTVHRLGEDDFRLTSAEPNLLWMHDNAAGLDVEIREETEDVGALALQGPASCDILREITDAAIEDLGFFRVIETRVEGIPVQISRTGYTGDLGYELWVAADRAIPLWDALVRRGETFGIAPAGLIALDMVRVEAGLILIDVDYVPAHRAVIEDRKSSPFELGLGWTVARGKGPYVGRGALEAERERGPEWELRGLVVDWESLEQAYAEFDLPPQLPGSTVRQSVPVYVGEAQVGYATSRCWSPALKRYLALAHLRVPHAAVGTTLEIEVTVEHRRRRARATVARTPFFDPARKRATPAPSPTGAHAAGEAAAR